ncbi:enoyl-CoA hydratase/isomerase family protein, partial [Leucobacter sp. M11]|uniref:enoyl-CoA hydratase/isomerase family protein n=1 Tax=Leucobacter sp. M11 TaxID=2993565 RepID=UPI002D7E202E
ESPVLREVRGGLGLLRLNRPRAINALTHDMVRLLAAALDAWRDDPEIRTVAIVGEGERGLCAGGDIVALYRDATAGDGTASARFWADEYRLNAQIAGYPKPIVALQDGLVLGGGIGVSGHASHRVVTERSRLGFPEVGIGFVPDVGATWLLTRSPGELGTRIALTGEHLGAADAILVGLADRFVPAERLPELLTALETGTADAALAAVAEEPPPGHLAGQRAWTDAAFAADSVPEILAALRASPEPAAAASAAAIEAHSPTALAITRNALRAARALDTLEAALRIEYRISTTQLSHPDFAEGVRAQVIDKDRRPAWHPAQHPDPADAAIRPPQHPGAHGDLDVEAPPTMARETP